MKIVLADIHSNLKMIFNHFVNQKFVHVFNSKMELAEMIAKMIIDHEVPRDKKSCGIVSSALISTGRIDF